MAELPPLTRPGRSGDKPRVRMHADGSLVSVDSRGKAWTTDSFENFLTRTGVGTGNIGAAGTYGFYPISRNRLKVEWAYRSSWIVGTIVDCVAEDMTREGAELLCDASPEEIGDVQDYLDSLQVSTQMCDTEKWSRLYGGSVGMLMVDGQNPETPLNLETISKDQFRGVFPLDRWALFPSLDDLVSDQGPDLGNPRYYEVRPDSGTGLPYMKLHYSRVIRLEGVRLPYWQRITENYWGQSVIERLWDRLIAFDSATNGTAQLVYKAHLRNYKVKDLRKIIALGGPALDGLLKQINMIRQFQSNEGMTLMDTEDEFEVHPYTFTGLDLVLLQFGQQLSGASQIPLVRLFGQSPAGLNATGESDLRTYYDGIKRQQNGRHGIGVRKVYEAGWRSKHGKPPPDGWKVQFKPLWQMDDEQRAAVAQQTTDAIVGPFEKGVTARSTTLKELKQSGKVTGMWTNITDEMIEEAVAEDNEKPPSPEELAIASGKVGPDGKPFTNGANANGEASANGDDSLSSFSLDARWDESKHKRDKNGEFSTTGGTGSSGSTEVKKKLTSTEKTWLENYSGDEFLKVNTALRNGEKPSGTMVDKLDSAMEKSSIPAGTTVFRGMSREAAKKLFPDGTITKGQVISDKGYSSTSKSAGVAMSWGAGGVLLKIETGENASGIDMSEHSRNKHEQEVLLPRDAKMTVVGITGPKSAGDPVIVRVAYGDTGSAKSSGSGPGRQAEKPGETGNSH